MQGLLHLGNLLLLFPKRSQHTLSCRATWGCPGFWRQQQEGKENRDRNPYCVFHGKGKRIGATV